MLNRLSNLSNRAVLGILIAVVLASSVLSLVFNIINEVDTTSAWWVSWLQNFSTEMCGAFLTFVLLTLVIGNRQEKERLIRQMRSKIPEVAVQAVEELRDNDWLRNGKLQGAFLRRAKLQKIDLSNANLRMADFGYSNLQGTVFYGADIRGVFLYDADLRGVSLRSVNAQRAIFKYANLQTANLLNADLSSADLRYVDLEHAVLREANLRLANLHQANLKETDLKFVQFDESTILPDGTHWTPDVDLRRFADPSHPQFWRSDDPDSPAYRGKDAG